jgi:GntR family transcriptional repressor for pyruvate dehydrogenase complex
VSKTSLADDLTDRLLKLIRSGDYKPGDRLPPIMKMAHSFGVGHPTLREALRKLEVIGAVEIKHGSGVYVKRGHDMLLVSNPIFSGDASKKLLLDLVEARIPIETRTIALAADNASDEDLDRMAELLAEAEANFEDDAKLNEANMSFHRKIAKASGNTVLSQLEEVLSRLFLAEQQAILNIYGSRERDHQEHLGLLEAIRARDPELAKAKMLAHLEGVRDAILQWDSDQNPLP